MSRRHYRLNFIEVLEWAATADINHAMKLRLSGSFWPMAFYYDEPMVLIKKTCYGMACLLRQTLESLAS